MAKRQILNGEYQTTVRIPEKVMQMLESAFRLNQMVFNELVIDALEHYSYCPVRSPRQQLETLGVQVKENRERVRKIEIEIKKFKKRLK